MNRFSRIRHHVDMKDVRHRHLEEVVAKKIIEKQIEEEKRIHKEIYDAWKSDWRKDILDEGMTTQMLTGILPSAGDQDLQALQLGLTGDGLIDYGQPGVRDETMENEGEYTVWSSLDDLTNITQNGEVGDLLRMYDQNDGTWSGLRYGGGGHGFLIAIPGYVDGMVRNAKPSGDYTQLYKRTRGNLGLPAVQNDSDLYYHLYGHTNDNLGTPHGSWNSLEGLTNHGVGTHLRFDGPGSPRFAALKAIDSTEVDTIKIHALVGHGFPTTYTDPRTGKISDPRVQIYYWSGDHKDYKRHPDASIFPTGSHKGPNDGWRPINMKPDGTIDSTVNPYIIDFTSKRELTGIDANGIPYSTNNKLHPYSLKIPEYARSKNARYMIFQMHDTGGNTFGITSVRFQRKNTLRVPSISARLTDIEAAPFIRVGQGVGDKNAEQRRKRVRDMIKASLKYGQTKFGDGVITSTNID